VNTDYVDGVRNAGAMTFFTTKWMNGVLVHCSAAVLPALEDLVFVDRVELVAPGPGPSSGRRSVNLRKKNNHAGVETESQLRMIGVDRMQQADYKGQGITIAILDSGFPGVNLFPAFEHIFSAHRFNDTVSYDFVHHSRDVFQHDDHGTQVLSVIAANIPDAFTGGAYEVNLQLYVTEDVPTEYRIEEYNWLFAAERADSAGVDMISSSLGYYDFDDPDMNYTVDQMDGKTAVVTRAAQWAADRAILVVVSAGNEGTIANWRIVTAPADAKDVLAVGGVNNALQKNPSSSIGPTADNRIKPDVVALGAAVKVVNASGHISTASGTSLATPLISSLAAGVWQRYPDLSNLEIIDLLKKTSSQANNPDNLLGYGIPNFSGVVNFQENVPQTEAFEVFPNPLIEDTLTISPLDPEVLDSWDIEIISAQGQVLAKNTTTFNWLNRVYRADMSQMASGIYYIRVFSEQKRYTFKVVKL
jgi:subtilisin family serine protease